MLRMATFCGISHMYAVPVTPPQVAVIVALPTVEPAVYVQIIVSPVKPVVGTIEPKSVLIETLCAGSTMLP